MGKPIYLILYKHQRYLDFNTLLHLYSSPDHESFDRSNLYRFLQKSKIKTVNIKNQKIYSLEDILGNTEMVGRLKNITALLPAMEED